MSRKYIQLAFSILLLAGLALGFAIKDSALANSGQADPNVKIEGMLLDKFASEGTADFIVTFSEKADLSSAYTMDWDTRGHFVYDTLTETAQRVQALAKNRMDGFGLRYRTFIAGNELYVYGGNLEAANAVAALPEVSTVLATRIYHVDPVLQSTSAVLSARWPGELLATHAETSVSAPSVLDWGITDTAADQFWGAFGDQGSGIVVANIDTGVDYTHIALAQNYKCAANPSDPACWLDPTNDCPTDVPCDAWPGVYHGTHTMGTMVGDDDPSLPYQVGMAPDAQWIACLGCPYGGCPDVNLFACADWILAPGGNSDNRPNVVNNSWGGGGGNNWYLTAVESWVAAGVFPAFSAGNSYSCNSLGSPGDYQESFASAAHRSDRIIADFSSKGPSVFGDDPYTKPNISAPGEDIMSAMPGDGWQLMSGTSMASPHTAGAVALLWSCNPGLVGQIDQTFQILQDNTDTAPAGSCGAPTDGEGNYTYGYGYLNVLTAGFKWCGETGAIDGHVYDAVTDEPIIAATVHAQGEFGGGPTTSTGEGGYYTMTATAGVYDMSAVALGYEMETVNGVTVITDAVTTQDFSLIPQGTLFGYVTDYDNGFPLAKATVTANNGTSAITDDLGYYEMFLDEGTYTVTAFLDDYAAETADVVITSGLSTQQDFALQAAIAVIPSPAEITLNMGATGSLPVELLNRQEFDYAFEFNERNGGFTPALNGGWIEYLPESPAVSPDLVAHNGPFDGVSVTSLPYRYHGTSPLDVSIIVYSDDDHHTPNYVVQALQTLGLSYTHYGNPSDPAPIDQFTNAVNAGGWDLVILAEDSWIYLDAREYTAVNNHLLNGGSAIVHSWGIGYGSTQYTNPLWATMGMTYNSWVTSPQSLYWWEPSYPIFNSVPEFTNLTDIGYLAYGAKMTPIEDVATALGGFTTSPTAGEAGIVLRDDLKSLYKGLTDNLNSADQDADGPDAWELWVNSISFIINPNIDVPWLSEAPITGIIPANGSLDATLYFSATQEAGIIQPGDYFATLVVKGDPTLEVPVNMNVLPPATWGKLEGTVTDICMGDQLKNVLVSILDGNPITETLTNDIGYFSAWLEQGTYTLTFSADGYISTDSTVDIIPGQVATSDIDLVPDRPCISVHPDFIEAWVVTDTAVYTYSGGLQIIDKGNQDLTFEINEKLPKSTLTLPIPPAANNAPLSGNGITDNVALLRSNNQPMSECIVAVTAGTSAIEQEQLHATLDEFGYTWLDVNSMQEALDAGANVLIDHYAAVNLPQNDIATWLSYGFGYIEMGDWPQWFPDTWTGAPAGTPVDIEVVDNSHPLMDGLPASWIGMGFWAYDWPGNNAVGWVTDPGYPNLLKAGYYGTLNDRAVTYQEVGDGKAVYLGVNVYGYLAGEPDKQLFQNAITWTGGCGVPQDVTWIWEVPVTGTVTAGSTQDIGIYFTSLYTDSTPMPLGTYTATLKIDNNDPVAKAQTIPVVMHIVSEYLAPTADFSATTPVNVGNPTEFTNLTTGGTPPANSFEWDFGDGITMTVGTTDPVSHLYATFGTFTVTLKACNNQGLCGTASADVVVLPKVILLPLINKH